MPAKSPLNQINADGFYVTDQEDQYCCFSWGREKLVLFDKNISLITYSDLHHSYLAQDYRN